MASLRLVAYHFLFFSSRRRHTRYWRDWSSDVCSSDLDEEAFAALMGADPDAAADLLADLALATDRELRSAARRLAARVFVQVGRVGSTRADRKSVVSGKSVDLGGRRTYKKKKKKKH